MSMHISGYAFAHLTKLDNKKTCRWPTDDAGFKNKFVVFAVDNQKKVGLDILITKLSSTYKQNVMFCPLAPW